MGKILSFVSGKGGTGKTSLCAAIGSCLSAMGDSVLCIDLDIGLRNLDLALGLGALPQLAFTDLMRGSYSADDLAPVEALGGLRLLTAPVTVTPDEIDEAAFAALLADCRERFDWTLLDAPAGIGTGFALANRYADEQILVTGGDGAALRDGASAAYLLVQKDKPAKCIVNRVTPKLFRKMRRTVDDAMDAVGLSLLGVVPEDESVPLAAASEAPLVLYGASPAAKACLRIARRIKGLPTPLGVR